MPLRGGQGGVINPHLDREIGSLNLSDQEKKALVAFLESLTGNIRFRDAGDGADREQVTTR